MAAATENMTEPCTSAEGQYRYRGLGQEPSIRLINADITRQDGEISCQLFEISINASLPYHCLSYTWGNPFDGIAAETSSSGSQQPDIWSQRKRIRVSSPEGAESGYLMVTKNLHDFLEDLERCKPQDIRYLWIDAISINQEDLAERARQVKLMKQIYKGCRAVIAWFGVLDADAAAAFTILPYVDIPYGDFISKVVDATQSGTANTKLPLLYAALDMPPPPPDVLLSSVLFLQRSWLYRVWTLQECMLPAVGHLWCGGLRAPLASLGNLISLVNEAVKRHAHPLLRNMGCGPRDAAIQVSPGMFENIERILYGRRYLLARRGSTYTRASRDNDCLDPRDKLYGMLGVLKEVPDIVIDYAKPVEDVYLEWKLKHSSHSTIQDLEDPSIRLTQGLPSWVPDYSVPSKPISWKSRAGEVYTAGRPGSGIVSRLESDDPRVLALLGVNEDEVAALGASYEETVEGGYGLLQSLRLLLDRLDLVNSVAGQDPVEGFWRTLIANLPGNGPQHPITEEFGPSFRALASYLIASHILKDGGGEAASNDRVVSARSVIMKLKEATGSRHLPDWDEVVQLATALHDRMGQDKNRDEEPAATDGHVTDGIIAEVIETMMPYLKSLDRMFSRRRFFITTKGRLAIGPHVVRPSDRIFVLTGHHFPFVLRGSNSGKGQYIVLGEAYVHGIMFGEALEGDRELQRVEIA